jgi:hypothetical protein
VRAESPGPMSVEAAAAAPGTLQELLQVEASARRRPRPRAPMRTRASTAPGYGQSARRLFLLEFECRGDLAVACQVSGCTPYDVRHWRTSDPMFDRDFILAVVGHVQMLKRTVHAIGTAAGHPHADRARQLLAKENHYVASDGRLDLRAWRDALKAFLESLPI